MLAHLHAGSFVMWFLKSTAPSSGLKERYLAMLVLDRGRREPFTMIPPFGPKIMTHPFGQDPLSTPLIGCSYSAPLQRRSYLMYLMYSQALSAQTPAPSLFQSEVLRGLAARKGSSLEAPKCTAREAARRSYKLAHYFSSPASKMLGFQR